MLSFTFACAIAEKKVKWVPLWVGAPYVLSGYMYADVMIRKFLHDEKARSRPHRTLEGIPRLSNSAHQGFAESVPLHQTNQDKMFILFNFFRELGSVLPRADAVVLTSYREAGPAPLTVHLRSKFQELLLVGSLTVSFAPPPQESGSDRTGCLSWLDEQEHQTVAYIRSGSIAGMPSEELFILTEALETSRTPHLWSLKDHLKVH
ncbi:hypothetical protein CDL15_Pgr000966 [Punica granatum]|uniref:Uncharacterized protein n=1 Tax=Punica granatum TaxID=22663 RepID=A0A218XIH7_PUNGR|nr:hypothetical protein CDL15_Pgr000966 [Punica granatum]